MNKNDKNDQIVSNIDKKSEEYIDKKNEGNIDKKSEGNIDKKGINNNGSGGHDITDIINDIKGRGECGNTLTSCKTSNINKNITLKIIDKIKNELIKDDIKNEIDIHILKPLYNEINTNYNDFPKEKLTEESATAPRLDDAELTNALNPKEKCPIFDRSMSSNNS